MRIVATSDTHKPVNIDKPGWFPDADVFIHAGDLMRTGYPSEWYPLLNWMEELPYKIKIFVPGNHDRHLEVYQGAALQELRQAGVTLIGFPGNHRFNSYKLPNGMSLLGLPYVVDLPRWAFNISEENLANHLNLVGKHDVIVSHAPILGHLDELKNGKHTGIELYDQYLQLHKPRLWINGHIHESYGHKKVGDTDIYNVAMCNRDYKHVNRPVIIDL